MLNKQSLWILGKVIMSNTNHGIELISKKINRFFVEQIPQLEIPIIDAKENCVTIGPYRIITNRDQYTVWRGKSHLVDIYKKNWAISYAMALYRGEHAIAKSILEFNRTYEKLDEDRNLFLHHVDRAEKREDSIKKTMFANRLSRVESEIFGLEKRAATILKSMQI